MDDSKYEYNDNIYKDEVDLIGSSKQNIIVKGDVNIKGGRWMFEEDQELIRLVKERGVKNWSVISQEMGGRNRIQCL